MKNDFATFATTVPEIPVKNNPMRLKDPSGKIVGGDDKIDSDYCDNYKDDINEISEILSYFDQHPYDGWEQDRAKFVDEQRRMIQQYEDNCNEEDHGYVYTGAEQDAILRQQAKGVQITLGFVGTMGGFGGIATIFTSSGLFFGSGAFSLGIGSVWSGLGGFGCTIVNPRQRYTKVIKGWVF